MRLQYLEQVFRTMLFLNRTVEFKVFCVAMIYIYILGLMLSLVIFQTECIFIIGDIISYIC